VADELAETRPAAGLVRRSLAWPSDVDLRKEGAELDSLELENCTARISSFFRLFEVGIEDLLLAKPSIDGWAQTVKMAAPHLGGDITVLTSGTTGQPKKCTHHLDRLAEDAHAVAGIIRPKRILSNVFPHHVYGFIYTTLMPSLTGTSLIDLRLPGSSQTDFQAGDLIVTTPFLLKNLLRQTDRFPPGVSILSSSAALPAELADMALEQGALQAVDVYGASETLGIGWRRAPDQTYTLFDRWEFTKDQQAVVDVSGQHFPLMDGVDVVGEQQFRLGARRDNAVQIGGINVFPEAVEAALLEIAGVTAATVDVVSTPGCVNTYLSASLSCGPGANLQALQVEAADLVKRRFGEKAVPRFVDPDSSPDIERLTA